jgi:hypothetical protein
MIDERAVLAILRGAIAAIEQLAAAPSANGAQPTPPARALDSDLDSEWGDEVVKFTPRDWTGPNFKDARMSQTSAPFLTMLADTYAYFAAKNDRDGATDGNGRPKSFYDRRSEARARGWAARLANGWRPPSPAPSTFEPSPGDDTFTGPFGPGTERDRMPTHDEVFGAVFRQGYDDDIPF